MDAFSLTRTFNVYVPSTRRVRGSHMLKAVDNQKVTLDLIDCPAFIRYIVSTQRNQLSIECIYELVIATDEARVISVLRS